MKVLVKEKIADTGIEKLKEAGFDVTLGYDITADELLDEIAKYDGLIVRSATKVTADVIARATNLKVVGRAGIGVDNIDVEAATKRGVIVANAPQSNIISAAEHTIALLLAQARSIPQADASLKAGKWERSKFEGVEVYEKTLGLVGLGRIGTLVAQRAAGLGMRVVGFDPYVTKERYAQLGIEPCETLDVLLKEADFITVHLPKTKETIGLFGKKEFDLMKNGVRLINTARGGIYQEEALIEALESGKVASIGVDVYEKEPCTESPLFAFPQAVVTPHLGASTVEAQDKAGVMIAEQVVAALTGAFVSNAINIALVPSEAMEATKPFLELCENLGRLYTALTEGGANEIEVEYRGQVADHDTKLLTVAVLKGLFDGVVEEPVNYVNAPGLAKDRGIEVRESKAAVSKDYTNLIRVSSKENGEELAVAGTIFGKKNQQRFVSIFEFDIDMVPSKYMAFFRYEDRPGMIGKVGTVLGKHNVNISNMQVGRKKLGGEALMGINVDTPISDDLLESIKAEAGISYAKFIVL